MSGTHIDYSDLKSLASAGSSPGEAKGGGGSGGDPDDSRLRGPGGLFRRLRRFVAAISLGAVVAAVLAVLPFFLLIRLSVLAYRVWGLGTWTALAVGVLATALLLVVYAWAVGRRLGVGRGAARLLRRGAVALVAAYAVYGLLYVAGANVKSEAVREEWRTLHPLLRTAASLVFLVDPASVMTDAGRTPEDYWLMGLPVNEASLHFTQDDGWVHALDLRTRGRPEWRNRALELGFWTFGFHTLRHVGTADHLHVSLRLPVGIR